MLLFYPLPNLPLTDQLNAGEGIHHPRFGEVLKEMVEDATNDERRALDRMLADASGVALGAGQKLFQSLPQIVQQAQQIMQQLAPQPMQDPRLAIEGQKLQLQAQTQQQRMAIEQQRMQQDAASDQQDMQLRIAQLQAELQKVQLQQQSEDARKAAELQARMAMNTDDNRTAMQLAAAEIASGERIGLSTGTGINPNPNQ